MPDTMADLFISFQTTEKERGDMPDTMEIFSDYI